MDTSSLVAMFRRAGTPLVRTDLSEDAAWDRTVAAVTSPLFIEDELNGSGDYEPIIIPVDDRSFEGLEADDLAPAFLEDYVGFVLLADQVTMTTPEDPTVVYVDMYDDPGRAFRCAIPRSRRSRRICRSRTWTFEEFANAVGPDGVFRGFGG